MLRLVGELVKFSETKWLRSRSNRGSLGMIATALAQAVHGSNNIQTDINVNPVSIQADQLCQNTSVLNENITGSNTGTELNTSKELTRCNNDNTELQENDEIYTSEFASPSLSMRNADQSTRLDRNCDANNEELKTSRFIPDGISQLTMGSFQVILQTHQSNLFNNAPFHYII